jgi:hypothetical protein
MVVPYSEYVLLDIQSLYITEIPIQIVTIKLSFAISLSVFSEGVLSRLYPRWSFGFLKVKVGRCSPQNDGLDYGEKHAVRNNTAFALISFL